MFSESLESFLAGHASLSPDLAENTKEGRSIPINLPPFEEGRQFSAWLVLTPQFQSTTKARIRLSKDAVLRVPHVESDGSVCLEGDPGPGTSYTDEERIDSLLNRFYTTFVDPWNRGELDHQFEKEAVSYWGIWVDQRYSATNPISRIFTVDPRPSLVRVYTARLLQPSRYVVAGDNEALIGRFISSLGFRSDSTQLINVLVADIPIAYPLSPSNWPKRESDLEQLLEGRLSAAQLTEFQQHGRRGREMHRVVILRAIGCSFGFLLSGGPRTVIKRGRSEKSVPSLTMLPLKVERLDPAWSYGRDQNPKILERIKKKVVVFGAGALGSAVIEQLAKAGVGSITVVDFDILSSANIGRHLLGAESIRQGKAEQLVRRISLAHPSVALIAKATSVATWLASDSLSDFDAIIDLTGDPTVRRQIEVARVKQCLPLVVGWMEPYVAAAHTCVLLGRERWFRDGHDPLEELQAVAWPNEVIQREPSCTSEFQSYTASAAAYAVAITAETTIALIDGSFKNSLIKSWVRGQKYLNDQWPGLSLRDWAMPAAATDGILLSRNWMSSRTFASPDGTTQIVLSTKVLEHIYKHAQTRWNSAEAGGQIFSPDPQVNEVFVSEATGPHLADKRSRHKFVPDPKAATKDRFALFEKGLHAVGLWHTHPEPNPSPSEPDHLATLQYLASFKGEMDGFLLLILGNSGSPPNLSVWLASERPIKSWVELQELKTG